MTGGDYGPIFPDAGEGDEEFPVLEDVGDPLQEDDGDDAPRATASRPRRGRSTKRSAPEPAPISAQAAREQDFDTWISSWNWDNDGMKQKITRTAPPFDAKGNPAVGLVYECANEYLTENEIALKFKGGTYRVSVTGVDHKSSKPNHHRMLGARTIRVPGEPLVPPNLLKANAVEGDAAPGYAAGMPPAGFSPAGDTIEAMTLMRAGYKEAADYKLQSANDMCAQKDQLMREQREAADRAVAAARAERDQLQGQINDLTRTYAAQLDAVKRDGTDLLKVLLPNTQAQAQNTIATMQQLYETRTATLESAFNQRIEAERRAHEGQIESQKQMYQGTITRMELDLTHLREENKRLYERIETLRDQLVQEIHRANQAVDPQAQLSKMGGMLEALSGLRDTLGGGGGSGGDDESPTNAIQLFDRALKVVPNIAEAITATAAARMQPAAPAAPAGAVAAGPALPQLTAPPAQPAAPIPPPRKQMAESLGMSKSELKAELARAIGFVNNSLANPQDKWPDPKEFARSAIGVVDNKVLRALASRDPDRLLQELETKGVLTSFAATDAGKAFLREMLQTCRELLA